MQDQQSVEIQRLRDAYQAFNARDIDAALVNMTSDVAWPRAFEGGFVQGGKAIREYWTKQWSQINPHVEPIGFTPDGSGRVHVDVHQVVRDLDGNIINDQQVGHTYTFRDGLIERMEVDALPSAG